MRTVAGLIIGLGLGMLLMYASVSTFRVTALTTTPAAPDTPPCHLAICFGAEIPDSARDAIAGQLRELLPGGSSVRYAPSLEQLPTAASLPSPSHVLLWGGDDWPRDILAPFGTPATSPLVLAFTPTAVTWADCRLSVSLTQAEDAADSLSPGAVDPRALERAVIQEVALLATRPVDCPLPLQVTLRPHYPRGPWPAAATLSEQSEPGAHHE